ncbi:MAG: putative LPS assembly protein LptD, partial [Chitinophagaceae bacterium]
TPDTSYGEIDSVNLDTTQIRYSKDTLGSKVVSTAQDSMVMDIPAKRIYLYGNASTVYKEDNLKADRININQVNGEVKAFYTLDSSGKMIGRPVFKQGNEPYDIDSLRYNFKTQKGVLIQTVTQQGQGYLTSKRSKMINKNTIFGLDGWYTTCDLDTPDFAIYLHKAKIIANKLIIAKGADLEIEGVPTPLYLPFFIFPIAKGQRSGILPPTYALSQQKGVGLVGLGYYLGLGEHFDMTIRGDVYSYGSWDLDLTPTYRKRYHYNGSVGLSISNTRFGDPKTPDFFKSKDFHITWSHTLDSRVRPGVNFSANVNAGTSTYNQYNVIDPAIRLNNTLASSIAFSKIWTGSPFNLTLSASHNQNTSTRQVSITLPEMSFNMNTIYPFQPANMTGTPKWYQKIGISYSMSARNRVDFIDSTFLKKGFFNRFQAGAQHNIPISFSLPILKYFTLSPNINYTETWFTQKMYRHYNDASQQLDTTYQKGFFTSHAVTTGVSLSTALYGMVQFKHGKIKAIRHVIRPSIGLSYRPDWGSQFYYRSRIDTSSYEQTFSVFDGNVYNAPSPGRFGGINFGINNNLEMKVASKKDTVTHMQKVQILNSFGINGTYNLAADSFKLSYFSLSATTTLFKKVDVSASGEIDPYDIDRQGRDINKYVWQSGKRSIGSLKSGYVSINTSFKSPEKGDRSSGNQIQPVDQTLNQQQQQIQRQRANPGDYANFNIPWSVNLGYSLNFQKTRTLDFKRDTVIYSQSLNFSGDFNLTPKWKISISSGFDFIHGKLNYTMVNITRDLHCWRMNISFVPNGTYKYFSITISPIAGVLHDLRFNRTRQFYDVFNH